MVKVRPLGDCVSPRMRKLLETHALERDGDGGWILRCRQTNAILKLRKKPTEDDVDNAKKTLDRYTEYARGEAKNAAIMLHIASQRINEAWLANIETGMSPKPEFREKGMLPGLLGPVKEEAPKVVYTVANPGKCTECGLKTVVTRDDVDTCEACALRR